jgi:hypothetical protein
MDNGHRDCRQQALQALQKAGRRALQYFARMDPDLFDGSHTAHDALVSLVFWQCEHLNVLKALLADTPPVLKDGTFATLNGAACECQQATPMAALLVQFAAQQTELETLLCELNDWARAFPIKVGGRPCTVEDRVFALASSIENQVAMLRKAAVGIDAVRSELN